MASRASNVWPFQHVNPSCRASNNSFSIRSILNLPEETVEKCTGSLRDDSLEKSFSVPLRPIVPRVVRPIVHHYVNSAPHNTLLGNWQDLRFAPFHHHCGYDLFLKEQAFPIGTNILPKKRRRPMRKKKQRPLFSPHQIQIMEKEFAKQRYVTEEKRAQLALEVNLTEAQVKTWFQNRRTKWKKETRDETRTPSRSLCKEDVSLMSLSRPRISPFCQNICVNSLVNPFRVMAPFRAVPEYSTFT